LDVVLSVNGIPLVTLELKNPLSGQTAANAIHQYRHDRDPRELMFQFTKRTLVHFAVDTEEAHMTSRLVGANTHFLPFNRGNNGGAGNAPDKFGRNYKTAYLWEEVLTRDSLLDLLARFLHLSIEDKFVWNEFGQPQAGPKGGLQGRGPQKVTDEGKKVRKESMIFPRYHQLQAVRQIVDKAASEGVGHNYLIEHSAGSGKSNTLAWLAHRLSSLHNTADQRIFESVIVITDRVVLDRQLQDTIYQFDHRQGVVQKIDEDSRQLAEALESAVPIIITTLQKFPFVAGQLAKLNEERGEAGLSHLPTRHYAVIIDEAHSSQSGETATELKGVLGGADLRQKAMEMAKEEGEVHFERLYRSMLKRGRQANMSFFCLYRDAQAQNLKNLWSQWRTVSSLYDAAGH
jgi:type I restriction enzyme, R subunit